MTIQINKNLDNYKEKVVFGLTAKQLIHVIIVGVICVGIVLGLHRFIGIMGAAWLCFPVAVPIALNGFYEWNGLGFMESMKLRLHYIFNNRPLRYISETESDLMIEEYYRKQEFEERQQVKKKKKGLLWRLVPDFKDTTKGAYNKKNKEKEAHKRLLSKKRNSTKKGDETGV